MKQKGFAFVGIILIVVVALSAAVGVWKLSSNKSNPFSKLKSPEENLKEAIGEKPPVGEMTGQNQPESEAVSIVKRFCDNFFKGPPAINEAGVFQAFGLLSQKAKNTMTVNGPSLSAVVAAFAGVVDVPDQGYSIDQVSETADKATVKTTWKYSSGPLIKIFDLEKENGSWKINAIN